MTQSIKGALLSGLVFPGLGQVVLKYYKRGIALIITVSIGLVVISVTAIQKALAILEKVELEGGAIDMSTITKAASQASDTSSSFIMDLIGLLLVCCWVFGIIDAYRIGKKIGNEE